MLFQDIVVNSAERFKSFSYMSIYEELMKIEGRLMSTTPVNNDQAANWITSCVSNQPIDPMSKMSLLLKMCFAHWLSIESSENTYRLCKSTTGITTGLGHGGLTAERSSYGASSRN